MEIDLNTLPARAVHDLLTSAIIPRPTHLPDGQVAWVSSVSAQGNINLAPLNLGASYLFRGVQKLLRAKTDFPQIFTSLQNLLYIVYNIAMTTKGIALKTIEHLPESASWEDIQERININNVRQ